MAESAVYSVVPGAQAGFVWNLSSAPAQSPAIWSGTASSLALITSPALPTGGSGSALSDTQVVGTNAFSGHPFLYDRATHIVTDLHPTGEWGSDAFAVAGGQQVGDVLYLSNAANPHAALWRGSAQSLVDLHPAGATWSIAHATNGSKQGGDVAFPGPGGGPIVAGIWSGSAASFVNLNPYSVPGVTGSQLRGVGGDQEVGWVDFSANERAALWRGTAASYVSLNPSWADASLAYGTDGQIQAGYVAAAGISSACIWSGTAESCVRLDQYLPPGYRASIAYSVAREADGRIIVGGVAYPNGSPYTEAFLWVYVPSPSGLGAISIAGVFAFRRRRRSTP